MSERECTDCHRALRVIVYRFGPNLVCFFCAIARMKKGEQVHV